MFIASVFFFPSDFLLYAVSTGAVGGGSIWI